MTRRTAISLNGITRILFPTLDKQKMAVARRCGAGLLPRKRRLICFPLLIYAGGRTFRSRKREKRTKDSSEWREGNSHYAFEAVGNVPNETTLNLSPLKRRRYRPLSVSLLSEWRLAIASRKFFQTSDQPGRYTLHIRPEFPTN